MRSKICKEPNPAEKHRKQNKGHGIPRGKISREATAAPTSNDKAPLRLRSSIERHRILLEDAGRKKKMCEEEGLHHLSYQPREKKEK